MQTVREFLNRAWYAQNVAVVDLHRMPENANVLEHALFVGENYKLPDNLAGCFVKAFGVFDNVLIIQIIGGK